MSTPLALLRRRRGDRVVLGSMLVVMAALWVFPLYTALRMSLEVGGFGNYLTVLTNSFNGVALPRAFLNSVVVAVLHAVLVCGVGALAGYAFAKLRFSGRDVLFYVVLLCLAIPGTAIMVPVYYITGNLGLFDNYFAVALPEATLTLPFAVLLLRNYADGIPDSLIESALLDRAGHGQIFRTVFLPLARPALVNLAALCVMWSLQDYLWPSMFLTDPSMTTAAQAVQTIQGAFGNTPQQTAQFYAALVLLSVPAVLLVVFGLRFITQGITSGGVKE